MMKTSIPDLNNYILCYYVNRTNQIQITRIVNIPNSKFERVVFPQQRLMFGTLPSAILEIHTLRGNKLILLNLIECNLLSVQEKINDNQLEVGIA